MSKQSITCEGCGSKWVVIGVGNQIVARLAECPLCAEKDVDLLEQLSRGFSFFGSK